MRIDGMVNLETSYIRVGHITAKAMFADMREHIAPLTDSEHSSPESQTCACLLGELSPTERTESLAEPGGALEQLRETARGAWWTEVVAPLGVQGKT